MSSWRIPAVGVLAAVAMTVPLTISLATAASGPTGHGQIPAEVPSTMSPAVNDGQVQAIVQVGDTVVIGGTFSSLTPRGGAATARSKVATFDASTGALRPFSPTLNGDVQDVLAGPVPDTVYVAGYFTNVSGTASSHLALLNVRTGALVPGFKAPPTNGAITTIDRAANRLLLGGYFTSAGGQEHKGLAAVHPTTGAIDHAYMGIDVSERHNNSGSGSQGAIGVKDMEATPDGTRLAVIGNFRRADGLDRVQAMIVDLRADRAVVDPGWRSRRFEPLCYSWAFDSYMRGVAVSPDGAFFAISTTGGGTRNTACDTATRFDFSSSGQDVQPTWLNSTGGDTLWSVEVTEQAVYVGGHQRWQNNTDGQDYANQGAVPRPGLAALDVQSGVPIEWNPGRLPRGAAAFAIYASPTGLWVGSDTDYFGNWKYKRPKLGYFPLAGGYAQASDRPASLPGAVYLGGRTLLPPAANNLSTFTFDGTTAGPPVQVNNRGIAWDSVRGAFLLGDVLFYGKTDGYLYKRAFTSTATGPEVRIDPYNDPEWAEAPDGVGGTERGKVPTLYGQLSGVTGMFASGDRVYYTRSGDSNLYWRWFNADSGIVGSQVSTANGGRSWTDTGGMFKDGNSLYIVSRTTGRLHRIAFDNGAPSGAVTVVDQSRDWRARVMFIGPGAPRVNEPPTASFTVTCSERTCSVDGSASSDGDGAVTSYAWTFGDGATAATATPAPHTYGADGRFDITLTVTDNDGAVGTLTKQVEVTGTPPPASDLAFVGQSQTSALSAGPTVAVPAGVQAGDRLVLVGSYALSGTASVSPTPPAGWELVSSRVANGLESHVWTRPAMAGDAGSAVRTALSASAKSTLSLMAYRGAAPAGAIAAIGSAVDGASTQHMSPSVTAPAGAWVVQVWTDKSSGTTAWTAPVGPTVRGTSYGAGTGRTSALLSDSGGPVSSGPQGGQVATTDASSGRAIAWTIALQPSE